MGVLQAADRLWAGFLWLLMAAAALCIGLGLYPRALYDLLPMQPVEYHPYSAYHVFEMVLVMAFCAVAFLQALARMEPHRGRTLDLDELYRLPSQWLAGGVSVRLPENSRRPS